MTLLELLVKELPNRGGWAEDVFYVTQDSDGQVNSYGNHEPNIAAETWKHQGFMGYLFDDEEMILSEDWHTSIITRDQYEAALAASQQPVWDGEGLPPVGVECEFFNDDYKCRSSVPENGTVVKIVAHQKSNKGMDLAVFTWAGERGGLHAEVCTEMLFRPIRTEAERKREESIQAMNVEWRARAGEEDDGALKSIYEIIYDAIAAGKIPGVKLTDGGE